MFETKKDPAWAGSVMTNKHYTKTIFIQYAAPQPIFPEKRRPRIS